MRPATTKICGSARINGSPPPGFVTEGNSAIIEFLGGAITLDKDGTFYDSTEVRVTPKFGGPVEIQTDIASGNYRSANDTVFFTSTRGERYYMVYITQFALQQELSGSLLLYNH